MTVLRSVRPPEGGPGDRTAAGPLTAAVTALSRLLPAAVPVVGLDGVRTGGLLPPGRGAVVAVAADWDADVSGWPAVARPVLPVVGVRGRLVVGPLVRPGRPGCARCLSLRVRTADRAGGAISRGRDRWDRLSGRPAGAWWAPGALRVVAAVVEEELRREVAGEEALTADACVAIGPGSLAADLHPALPHALCRSPHCTAAARPSPPPVPRGDLRLPSAAPGSSRSLPVARLRERLADGYLDPWSGVVRSPALGDDAALPTVQVDVPTAWGFDEVAVGRGADFADARTAAVLEGLERYAGWHCGGRDPVAWGAQEDLPGAVDVARLLLHPDDEYDRPGFGYQRWSPRTPTAWAPAHDARTGRERLLPFHVAHYGASRRSDAGPAFVYENSNGCAVGSGAEEAVLAGLLEVVERDAFLCAWYARAALPEVAAEDLPPAVVADLDAVRRRTGRTHRLFTAVGLFGIPVAVLVSTSEAPSRPSVLVTAGAGLTVGAAARGAAHEMAAVAPAVSAEYASRVAALRADFGDPRRVRRMTDHALYSAVPEARYRFAHLLGEERPATGRAGAVHVPRDDVAADLAALLASSEREVLVVDQTTVELRRAGLRCVKTVVPGAAPMTFGHAHRRPPGDAALDEFLRRNGLPTGDPDDYEEARRDPHPFP